MTLDFTTDARLDPTADLHTATGLPLWYLEPHRTPVRPEDLRIHCTHARRYAGAINVPLLLHLAICVTIARALGYPDDVIRAVAAHDLHEAYIGDIPTRLKRYLGESWREIEDVWERRVHAAFGLEVPTGDVYNAVKRMDLMALELEMSVFCHPAYRLTAGQVDREVYAALHRDVRWLSRTYPTLWWHTVATALNVPQRQP